MLSRAILGRTTSVKVCGLTRSVDVDAAVAAGASTLGFVVHDASARHVEPTHVAKLLERRGADQLAVLVMVDPSPALARQALQRSGADALQLCGAEQAADWRDFPAPLLRRLPVSEAGFDELRAWRELAALFILDHPANPGGSGLHVKWQLAARLALEAPCLLAGGLGADDVAAAIEAVRPLGVDASSRLELKPGHKSAQLIHEFVRRAREALTPTLR